MPDTKGWEHDMMKVLLILFTVYIVLVLLFFLYPIKYPLQRIENDYAYAKFPLWHLYFLHKWVSPVPNPDKGSGLKKYFQNLQEKVCLKKEQYKHLNQIIVWLIPT